MTYVTEATANTSGGAECGRFLQQSEGGDGSVLNRT